MATPPPPVVVNFLLPLFFYDFIWHTKRPYLDLLIEYYRSPDELAHPSSIAWEIKVIHYIIRVQLYNNYCPN